MKSILILSTIVICSTSMNIYANAPIETPTEESLSTSSLACSCGKRKHKKSQKMEQIIFALNEEKDEKSELVESKEATTILTDNENEVKSIETVEGTTLATQDAEKSAQIESENTSSEKNLVCDCAFGDGDDDDDEDLNA